MLELAKLLSYPGGDNKYKTLLLRQIPAHRVYVEPFCGSATVFFAKEPAEVSVIGDTDPNVINFYLGIRDGELLQCREQIRTNREKYNRLHTKFFQGKGLTTCEFLELNKTSFFGSPKKRWNSKEGPVRLYKPSRAKEQINRLRSAHIVLGPFDQTMRRFDSPETFHYLDPPWVMEYSDAYHTGISVTPQDVYEVAASMQGKVLIIYNDHPSVREALCRPPFRCFSFEDKVSLKHIKGVESRTRLAAKNY